MKTKYYYNNSGFSIIELTVVMVIGALIATTIFGATTLTDSLRRNTAISDMERFKTAYKDFKEKYKQIPGDDINIAWCATTTNCYNGTGDGSGLINFVEETGTLNEPYLAWQHLALAGFIKGSYTGNYVNTDILNKLVPAGPFGDSGYTMAYYGTNSGYGNVNAVILSKISPASGSYYNNFTSPESAALIDTKIDDGNPLDGIIAASSSTASVCVNGTRENNNATTASYNVANKTNACYIIYFMERPYG